METSSQTNLHVHCDRSHLLAAIQAADAVVPSNSTKPILTNLLLDALADRLEIVATDTQVGLRSVVPRVDMKSAGQAVVQARQVAVILKESTSPLATLILERKADASVLSIRLSDGDYQVPAIVGEQFPPVSFFPSDVPSLIVDGKRFEEMLRQTSFAIDRDRTSAVLSGLYMAIGNGELVIAATDGKVLCEAIEKISAVNAEAIQAVIPAVTINHLQRIIASTQPEKVELAFAGKLVFVRLALDNGLKVDLTSRLVEGSFPTYRNALQANASSTVTFVAAELASAVRRAALMTNQTSRGIVLSLDKDQAVLSNLNYTNGSARIPVVCNYAGAEQKFGINSQYLTDVLKAYQGEKLGIELGRGLIMRATGVTFLIMPISLPN